VNRLSKTKILKSLKKKYLREEQAFKLVKKAYLHLSNFTNEEILAYFGLESRNEILDHLDHNKIVQDQRTKTTTKEYVCTCIDSDGESKYLYATNNEAKQRCVFLEKEQNITLKVYACPTTNGWHLTKM